MFKITMGKGFQMTFDNGLTISVQCGAGNYCDNRNKSIYEPCGIIQSNNAEIAVWDKNGQWVTDKFTEDGNGSVAGWKTVEEVFKIMMKVQSYKTI